MTRQLVANQREQLRLLAEAYMFAKCVVIEHGYAAEVDWQYSVSLGHLNEQNFLCEVAWVILCSGMRESIIRRKFHNISRSFLEWESARSIIEHRDQCKSNALISFNHVAKVDAILSVATIIYQTGFTSIAMNIGSKGVDYLRRFPYIGPITSFHLAKNIGLPVAKPDRHLTFVAEQLGYKSVQRLCADIAGVIDEPIPVVDVVLWRYSTLRHNGFSELLASISKAKAAQ